MSSLASGAPDRSRFSLRPLGKGTTAFIAAFAALVALAFFLRTPAEQVVRERPRADLSRFLPLAGNTPWRGLRTARLPTFDSCQALEAAIQQSRAQAVPRQLPAPSREEAPALGRGAAPSADKSAGEAPSTVVLPEAPRDYSRTNVQVEGVDEADIVKTDGRFVYVYSQPKQRISILRAYPPDTLELLGTIPFTDSVQEFFLEGDHLAVFGRRRFVPQPVAVVRPGDDLGPAVRRITPGRGQPAVSPFPRQEETFLDVWNIRDRVNPKLERSIGFEGTYLSSRLRDGTVFVALNSAAPTLASSAPGEADALVPQIRDTAGGILRPTRRCEEIEYFDPPLGNTYFILAALPLRKPSGAVQSRVILGSGDKVYMSLDNFYVARGLPAPPVVQPVPEPLEPLAPGVLYDKNRDRASILPPPVTHGPVTEVHKFALTGDTIGYVARATVPGAVLNQFSMDEFAGYFRIATTLGDSPAEWENALTIFDRWLNRVGHLAGLAPGEQIYSARFLGQHVYLVTFRQVDPFFVIDASDPRRPRVLGKLKIPGFSQYLHPYDNAHIIGVGKHADSQGRVLGLKLALFDVSDVEHPREIDLVEIGGPRSDSEVLRDHKAFLFDRRRQLLVVPVTVEERGSGTFQGAYVFRVSLDGFAYRSRLSHIPDPSSPEMLQAVIRRSFTIDDFLYTVSNLRVFAHRLGDLVVVGNAEL